MKIIVLGSGWSGLYALKWLKQEFNVNETTPFEEFTHKMPSKKVQIITLEKEKEFGGVWNYKEHTDGGVFRSTCTTSSKTYMHACDFPMPDEYPQFPHHTQILEYLKNYAVHFNLLPFINYEKYVLSINKNYEENLWEVRVRDNKTNEIFELFCDKIVVALGQHQNPNWTNHFRKYQHVNSAHVAELLEKCKEKEKKCKEIEKKCNEKNEEKNDNNEKKCNEKNDEKNCCEKEEKNLNFNQLNCGNNIEDEISWNFTGKIIHAHQYKYPTEDMIGKCVLVIGGGESASDIANEVSTVTKKCYLSIRHGVWFHDRGVGGQQPADILFTRHQRAAGNYESFPIWIGRYIFIEVVWGKGGSGVPEWQPEAQYLHGFINKSRDVVTRVNLGYVLPKREIRKIEGNLVYFGFPNKEKYMTGEEEIKRKEKEEEEGCYIDTIILATGYQSNIIHLFNDQKYPTRGNPKYAFKLVFDVNDPSLAFVGNVRPVFGSIPGLVELQARWVAKVFSGKISLPRSERMKKIVKRDHKRHQRIYPVDDYRLFQLTNHFEYSDEIAKWMRVLPNIPFYLVKNPKLWWTLVTSPWTPFHYLLTREKVDEINTREKQNLRIETAIKNIEKSIDQNHYTLLFFNYVVLVIDFIVLICCILTTLAIYYWLK